ncbi:MAG: hypothetical protein Q7S87_09115 [Agitococcus sp.]|nr:hypothetical protein [Agitococcus sp.]MDO9177061.1 hypothetical protein [Agitococcus sp.]
MIGFLAIAGVVCWLIWLYKGFSKRFTAQRERVVALEESGFVKDHILPGDVLVAFDVQNRKVAFIYFDNTIVKSFDDILARNRLGKTMMFELRDPTYPLIKFNVNSSSQSETLYAMTSAILAS